MTRSRMQWEISSRADPRGARLADLHYSRVKPGTKQFVQAGKCVVLVRPSGAERARYSYARLAGADAVWVTTWPYAEYVYHAWGGPYPTDQTREVERLLKVDQVTLEPVTPRGHRDAVPRGFVKWVSDEPVDAVREGKLVTLRRALVRETPGAWSCALFRNESGVLSSHLILQAVAATRAHFGEPPPLGMVTMIQSDAVRSGGAGKCYVSAGFEEVGETQTRPFKRVFLLRPEDMPPPRHARGDGVRGSTTAEPRRKREFEPPSPLWEQGSLFEETE
jgi:hypothetical protein